MKIYILSIVFLVAALALGASPAHAVTIDFESLLQGDANAHSQGEVMLKSVEF